MDFCMPKLDFHEQIWAREIYGEIIIRVLNKNLKFCNFHQLQCNFLDTSIYLLQRKSKGNF